MPFKSFLKMLGIRQNSRAELVSFRVDASDVSASGTAKDGLDEGSNYATVERTGTGEFTFTLNRTCARVPVVVGAVAVGENICYLSAEPTTSGFVLVTADDAGTEANTIDFHVTLLMFFSDVER